MALQNQRAPADARRPVAGDHREGAGEIDVDRREARQMRDIGQLDLPMIDVEAARPQRRRHEILGRRLLAAQAGQAHVIGQEPHLIIEAGIDRAPQRAGNLGRHGLGRGAHH